MKVLIIDDEDDTRSIASMSLSILGGVDVVEAEGGLEGIAKAEQDRPDVILLDMMMPGMDGSQTLIELQKNPRTLDIPVIFLTAKAMSTEVDRLTRMGAIAVLTKPFDPTTLASQVEQILEKRGLKVTPSTVSDSPHNYNSMAPVEPAPSPTQPNAFPNFSRDNYQTGSGQLPGQNTMSPAGNQQGVPTAQTGGLISISRTSMFTGMNTIPPQGTGFGGRANEQPPAAPQAAPNGQQTQTFQQNQQNQQQHIGQQQPLQPHQQSGNQPQQYSQNEVQPTQLSSQPRNPFELLAHSHQQWHQNDPNNPNNPNNQQNQSQNQNQGQQPGQLTPQQQQWMAQQSITSDYSKLQTRPGSTAFNQNFPQGIAGSQPPYTVPGYPGQCPNLTPEEYSEQQKKLQQSVTEGLPMPNFGSPGILSPRPYPANQQQQQMQTGGYQQAPGGPGSPYPAPPQNGQHSQQPQNDSGTYPVPRGGYPQVPQQSSQQNAQGNSGLNQSPPAGYLPPSPNTSGSHPVPPSGYQQPNQQGTSGSHPIPGYLPPNQQTNSGVRPTPPATGGNAQSAPSSQQATSSNRSGSSAPRPEGDGVADPWVVAANENVQTSSSKAPVPKNAKVTSDIPVAKVTPGTSQSAKAPSATPTASTASNSAASSAAAAQPTTSSPSGATTPSTQAKPTVIKARPAKEEPKEPERKKFAHPWGQIHKPDWSGEADPLIEAPNDSQRDSGKPGKRPDDKK